MGSSQTRARTRVPCIGRRILNHCATREALGHQFRVQKRCEHEHYISRKHVLREIWSLVRTQGREILILLGGIQALLDILLYTFPQILILSIPLGLLVFSSLWQTSSRLVHVLMFAFIRPSSTCFEFTLCFQLLNFWVICTVGSNILNVTLFFWPKWKSLMQNCINKWVWLKSPLRTSLVVQWLRIRPPMQETRVQALVREDPTCRRATKPVCQNYWARAPEPTCHNYWSPRALSPCSTTREATAMRSLHTATRSSPCSPQLEKARAQQWRPNAAINK